MTSPSAAVLDVRQPRHLLCPPRTSSAGQEAVELAASAGLVLDPWEAEALEVGLGERADGKWSAFEVGLIVPRQNGKGSILEARELAGLFLFDEELLIHSAHEFKTAQEAFRRVLELVQSTPDLDRRVMRVRTSHGDEGLEIRGGRRLRFMARSTGSGRGFSGDVVLLDEAYKLWAKAIAALMPTMATRPNPQLWYASSAPLDIPESDVLRAVCRRGRRATSESLAYIEYCADAEADRDDPSTWADANPGFGIRIGEEFIGREREVLTDEDFARERLGIWFEDVDLTAHVIPPADWAACQDIRSGPNDVEGLAFALDVSPDRASAAFAVAGTSLAGGTHIEVIDHRPGTHWLVDRAVEIQKTWHGMLAIAKGSPAWSLEQDLTEAGVEIEAVEPGQHAQACGQFFDAIIEREIRHLGQPELNTAVAGADRRFSGDAWLWSRKASTVDITPLVAVTLAFWAQTQPAEAEADFFVI